MMTFFKSQRYSALHPDLRLNIAEITNQENQNLSGNQVKGIKIKMETQKIKILIRDFI
jgi:ABC-type phosphate/phosphonate transport system ATPase subunit